MEIIKGFEIVDLVSMGNPENFESYIQKRADDPNLKFLTYNTLSADEEREIFSIYHTEGRRLQGEDVDYYIYEVVRDAFDLFGVKVKYLGNCAVPVNLESRVSFRREEDL